MGFPRHDEAQEAYIPVFETLDTRVVIRDNRQLFVVRIGASLTPKFKMFAKG